MVDKDQSGSGINWTEEYGLRTEIDEEEAAERRIERMCARLDRQGRDRNGSNEEMPHTVTFAIEYEREQFVWCRADAFTNKEEALDAKSNLELVDGIVDTRIERV